MDPNYRGRGRTPPAQWPHPPGCLIALLGILVLVVVFIEVRAAGAAFALAGLDPRVAMLVLLGCLLGSALNIPVARIRSDELHVRLRRVQRWGVTYVVPVGVAGHTVVAVNVGGALIPAAVCGYLLVHGHVWLPAAVAATITAVVVHLVARPVPGVGIAVPTLVAPLVSAVVALALDPATGVATVAYVAGTVGTLVGADLTHLRALRSLRSPMVSIGGAGTFDGVFVSGILAVLLAVLL